MQGMIKSMFIVGDPDTVGEKVQELLDAGLDGLVCNLAVAGSADEVAISGDALARVLG